MEGLRASGAFTSAFDRWLHAPSWAVYVASENGGRSGHRYRVARRGEALELLPPFSLRSSLRDSGDRDRIVMECDRDTFPREVEHQSPRID